MSDFDNNGFENGETAETVETVETVENVETIDPNPGSYTAPTQETTYEEPAAGGGASVFAIISLVTGILSILCCCSRWMCIIFAVAAIVLGILSMNKEEEGRGMAIAGIICGAVGLVLGIIVIIIAAVGGEAANTLDPDSVENFIDKLEDL